MSRIEIEIPDDGWFCGNSSIKPHDKQLCVVISIGGRVGVYQYRKKLYGMEELLHNLSLPTYYSWVIVDRWKPLDIPSDVSEKVFAKIEN